MKIKTVRQVAEWRLCTGCGVCSIACPENKIKLVDIFDQGIRPIVADDECGICDSCIAVCPGFQTSLYLAEKDGESLEALEISWGSILEIWEGYAHDEEIRYKGSSGGIVTALALYCLENENMFGVLHTEAGREVPWRNTTVLSRNRKELLQTAGSRYSPASPCDGLLRIAAAPAPCVFVGKPCDIEGLRKAQLRDEVLNSKVGLAVGIFCAGTPSTEGTLNFLRKYDLDPISIKRIKYRGEGWPGTTVINLKDKKATPLAFSYRESWGYLQQYRPFRCYLCPDTTGESADISCGDPWYRRSDTTTDGYSLILVRTKRGREILHRARDAGYITLEEADPDILEASQINLLLKRRAVWGRLLTMKLFGIPTPQLKGFHLFSNWLNASIGQKIRSVLGTGRRIITRNYRRPQLLQE